MRKVVCKMKATGLLCHLQEVLAFTRHTMLGYFESVLSARPALVSTQAVSLLDDHKLVGMIVRMNKLPNSIAVKHHDYLFEVPSCRRLSGRRCLPILGTCKYRFLQRNK